MPVWILVLNLDAEAASNDSTTETFKRSSVWSDHTLFVCLFAFLVFTWMMHSIRYSWANESLQFTTCSNTPERTICQHKHSVALWVRTSSISRFTNKWHNFSKTCNMDVQYYDNIEIFVIHEKKWQFHQLTKMFLNVKSVNCLYVTKLFIISDQILN